MGLCKCPKRKVTNLFCYEHRVNVCLHCMVTIHPKCIVQSYIHWLQDSDYNPLCLLCNQDLASEDCIRLLCYHVFHWSCLDRYARQLPDTTAPAGFSCPTCKEPFFPQPNFVSPVADALREKLASVNWARMGLGLPLLSEEIEFKPVTDGIVGIQNMFSNNTAENHMNSKANKTDIVVHMEDASNTFNRLDLAVQAPRRTAHGMDNVKRPLLDDDDNKYRRRTPTDWIYRWSKLISNKLKLPRGPFKSWIMFLIMVLVVGIVIFIFSILGQIATADDPSLSLEKNPHLYVNSN